MSSQSHLKVIPGGASTLPLRELYQRYGSHVYGRCHYLLRDRAKAEDAMQEVFARAIEHQQGFRAEASPLTWLMKIATHHCLNTLRAERAGWWQRLRTHADVTQEERSLATGPLAFELRDEVRKLLSRCDLETQTAAVHYHVDEMTLEEVAALLGRSVPTIRKRLEDFARICGRQELAP